MTRLNQNDNVLIAGTAYEEILDSHFDITAAINKMKELGYTKIHLLGHSLGCTKIVYWYNKVNINNEYNISSVNLLSLVDIPDCQKYFFKHNFENFLEYALEKEKQGQTEELMPKEAVDEPHCVRVFLRYFKYNDEINFARFCDKNYEFKELNNIKVPLFIRWGNVNEIIVQKAEEVVNIVKNKVENANLGYIDGANHSFYGKEEQVIKEILTNIDR